MIHKVYIVRCSHCHAPLREPNGLDSRPRYFYQIDTIPLALKDAGWGVVNGMELCVKCLQQQRSYEL
jgi:hypothetical protein